MPTKKQPAKTPLSNWIFKIPLKFTCAYFIISLILTAVFAGLQNWLNIHTSRVWLMSLIIAFIFSAYYYIIKKLPRNDINRNDLVAIVNGTSIVAITIPLIWLLFIGTDMSAFQHKMMWMYVLHPNTFMVIVLLIMLTFLFLSGVAISSIYSKYKRAVTMGISKWKIFCSMPFTFLLMWMPGYLIDDKDNKTNLEIKSKWYSVFNKWVISDVYNTVLVFLTFLLFRNIFSGWPLLLLTTFLLALYVIWNLKYKNNLIKNLNRGYALSAVFINITILIIMLIFG